MTEPKNNKTPTQSDRSVVGSKKIAPPTQNKHEITVRASDQADAVIQIAKTFMGAEAAPAMVAMNYNKDSGLDINAMMGELRGQHQALDAGDMSLAEHMLLSQSIALQAMFADLATRAKLQTTFEGLQCLTGLALRAQSNCRATLLALGELKYPKQATFVRQANIANGPQQINNAEPARARKKASQQTKLLEADHGSTTLDAGTTGPATRGNPALATVEQVNRTNKPRR